MIRGAAQEGSSFRCSEQASWRPQWTVEKYRGDSVPDNLYATKRVDGNLLLNAGITALLTLLIGGTATAFSNANARIGVGDGTASAAATQTGLQGANKTYKGMDVSYPQVTNQTLTLRSTFGPTEANYDWQELAVDSGATGVTLNRKVEDHGTKASGDTWVVTLTITIV